MHLDIGFGFLKDFWGFSKLMRFLWNFWVGFCLNDPICSCIASHLHSHNILCVYRCVISLLEPCVLVGLDWAEPMMFFFVARHMIMHFSCIRTILFSFWYICWLVLVYFYLFLSLSLSLSVSCPIAPKHKSTLSHNSLRSVMKRPVRTSRRTFHNATFIWNAKLSYRTFPILTFPQSSTVGVESHYVASQSLVSLWSYMSFTLTCMDLIILYLISSLAFGVHVL